ncbi:MAG: primosomal protein N' [Bacteroidetes bacterium]|nr:primosomal protein N' [Bacteroidota bacterium]
MERTTLFAELLLPLPIKGLFTYRVPFELNDFIRPGQRVAVQFGRKKLYTALVKNIHEKVPKGYTPKYILSLLDETPIVNSIQFSFWDWISDYYMCHPGEVMNAALPSAFKLASESKIHLNPDFKPGDSNMNEREALIAEALIHRNFLSVKEASDITGQLKILPLINTMIEKRVIILEEELKDRYKPRMEDYVMLTEAYQEEKALRKMYEQLEKRAFKQLQILIAYINMSADDGSYREIRKSTLLKAADASKQQLKGLEKKGVFILEERIISRLSDSEASTDPKEIVFNEFQQKALEQIKADFRDKDVSLLYGVTSSGKTEIYIHLIDEVLRKGKQILYLLPEIALTTQIIYRLQQYFGDKVGVYHSRYNEGERIEIWNKVNSDDPDERYSIILGARSAVFLPFSKLGLVIVDEEHDQSYKQFDPAPRYHARDSAIYLAGLHGAKTLLGTATPSFESYFNAKNGKYGLIMLAQRYRDLEMPEIIVSDIRKEMRKKNAQSHFTKILLDHIEEALAKKEQVILFQNRRGFSPRLECEICAWIPMCTRCDISLTYHKRADHLRCHYCGYSTRVPAECGHCGSSRVLMRGFGTEKIEEELSIIIPEANIRRMDLDTTRKKYGHQLIINAFEKHEIDVLVGTQMVTKGLDFDLVSVVGIMNADNMINFPDFRAYERSFQLMAQVAGRSGRKNRQGKVIIQSYKPSHEVIKDVVENDFTGLYARQMAERNRFKYPPYYRLIQLKLLYKDYRLLNEASKVLGTQLHATFPKQVLGPEYPLVSRIKNQYIKQILIKTSRKESVVAVKKELQKQLEEFAALKEFKRVRIKVDVDPY